MGLSRFAPDALKDYVGSSRYFGWSEYLRMRLYGSVYRRRHARLSPRLEPGQVFLPPDLVFKAPASALNSFDAFAFADAQTVEEMSSFRKMINGRLRFYDVGAEAGCFSLVFARQTGGHALAWEPSPPQMEKLLASIALNSPVNIEPLPIACGPEDGFLEMVMDGVQLRASSTGKADLKVDRIAVRSIDSMVAERAIAPDAIKIDIEGFELGALTGARQCLSQSKPIIFLEVHPPLLRQTGSSTEAVFRLLSDLGYGYFSTRFKRLADPVGFVGNRIKRLVCVSKSE